MSASFRTRASGYSCFVSKWIRDFRHLKLSSSEVLALISPNSTIPDLWDQSPQCRNSLWFSGFQGGTKVVPNQRRPTLILLCIPRVVADSGASLARNWKQKINISAQVAQRYVCTIPPLKLFALSFLIDTFSRLSEISPHHRWKYWLLPNCCSKSKMICYTESLSVLPWTAHRNKVGSRTSSVRF